MSTENPPTNNPDMYTRNRRGSISQAALTNLFQRGNSVPNGSGFPGQVNNGAAHPIDAGRRRLSVTTLGLSGTSPTNAAHQQSFIRRGSMSTNSNNSDSIDESAIEEDDAYYGSARTAPTTPFVRRMSFGGSRTIRPGGSPGNGNNPTSPPSQNGRTQSGQKASRARTGSSISAALSASGRRASTTLVASSLPQASNTKNPRSPSDNYPSRPDQQGFNWSEQLRSRAESSVTGARPSFSLASSSPPRGNSIHDRAKSVSEMPQPPVQAPAVKHQPRQERPKPDAFQERILKGDFYMD
ncbi:Fc.00g066830.m01.CDS01 [Cosmosporella sp. VM-42]